MYLPIHPHRTYKETQQAFSAQFPYLKLEFFHLNPQRDHKPNKSRLLSPVQLNEKMKNLLGEGEVEISPAMTVAALEHQLQHQFGLSAQVFRKSGNLWLETTMTDQWSLKQQNDHGREISETTDNPAKPETPDFELSRGED